MPCFRALLKLHQDQYFPGGILQGEVMYDTQRQCSLKGAELKLCCEAFAFNDKGKKNSVDDRKFNVPIRYNDGTNTEIRETEQLGRSDRRTVFMFESTLPEDLLPSMSKSEDARTTLTVSYTLRLTSRRDVFCFPMIKEDYAWSVYIAPRLNLCKETFSKVATEKVTARDEILGRSFDIVASATLPKYGWEPGERMDLELDLIKLSSVSIRSQMWLERIIEFIHEGKSDKKTEKVSESHKTVDYTTSSTIPLSMEIPRRNMPASGVVGSPNISIHYQVNVEIRKQNSKEKSSPSLTLRLPILLGNLQPMPEPRTIVHSMDQDSSYEKSTHSTLPRNRKGTHSRELESSRRGTDGGASASYQRFGSSSSLQRLLEVENASSRESASTDSHQTSGSCHSAPTMPIRMQGCSSGSADGNAMEGSDRRFKASTARRQANTSASETYPLRNTGRSERHYEAIPKAARVAEPNTNTWSDDTENEESGPSLTYLKQPYQSTCETEFRASHSEHGSREECFGRQKSGSREELLPQAFGKKSKKRPAQP